MRARAHLVRVTGLAYLKATMAKKTEKTNYKVVAENRRARYDYAIEDDIEVGIILTGS